MNMMVLNFRNFLVFLIFILISCSSFKNNIQYAPKFERHVNMRYSFSLLIPSNFRQTFSENGDGIILTSIHDKDVEIRAYGHHNALFHTFEEEVSFMTRHETLLHREKLNTRNLRQNNSLYGIKILSEAENKRIIRATFMRGEDFFYTIRCQASENNFYRYRDLFENIIQSFRLTKSS